jgi:ankyrin repeat protein
MTWRQLRCFCALPRTSTWSMDMGRCHCPISNRFNFFQTLLHHAVQNGNIEGVRQLVDEDEVRVNSQDNDGNTALHDAFDTGLRKILRL